MALKTLNADLSKLIIPFETEPIINKTSFLSQQQNKEVKPTLINDSEIKALSDIETNTVSSGGMNIGNIKAYNKKGFGYDMQGNGSSGQPYITKKIGEIWGNGGNVIQDRVETDLKRTAQFLKSPAGNRFLIFQQSMQLMNPNVISIAPIGPNRIYNPLSLPAAIAGSLVGYHPERHGFFGTPPDYEDSIKFKSREEFNYENLPNVLTGNRMIRMLKERTGPLGLSPINLTLSSWGGPNSVGGVGSTLIFKTENRNPFTIVNEIELINDRNTYKNLKVNGVLPSTIIYSQSQPYGNYDVENSKLIQLLKISDESNTFKGWRMNYAAKKNETDYIDEDTYSRDNIVTVQHYDYNSKVRQSSSTVGISRLPDNELSNIKNLYEKVLNDKSDWNADGNDSINGNSFNPAGGFKVFDTSVVDEVNAYNCINGFKDLNDENIVSSYKVNGRGTSAGSVIIDKDGKIKNAGTYAISVTTPTRSKVGKYYKDQLGDRYYASMHDDVYTSNTNSPRVPDIGQLDPILFFELKENNYDRNKDAKNGVVNDFITFIVAGIQFRATLSGFTYNFSPNWTDIQYVGRPDPLRMYGGLTRDISFDFIIAAYTREEMDMIYYKLNQLACKVSPGISKGRMSSPISTLTIGNIVRNEFGYLSSLSFSVDENTTWDIDTYFQPMNIKVACVWTIIGKESPNNKAYYFGKVIKSDDRNGNKKYSDKDTTKYRPQGQENVEEDNGPDDAQQDPFI